MIPLASYLSSSKTLNSVLETWFFQNELLGGLPVSIMNEESEPLLGIPSKNIIYLELFQIDQALIQKAHDLGKKVVLIHMGDEFAKKDIAAYGDCDLILRNYYFPEMFSRDDLKDRILWIPNGFKSGVGPRSPETIKEAPSRQHLASFMGWIDNPDSFARERESFGRMVRSVRKSKGGRLAAFSRWLDRKVHFNQERREFSKSTFQCEDLYLLSSTGFASGNNVGLYSATMENSIFAPCPAGNSPETIRLYDALESGCIPVCLDHEFLRSEQALAAIGPVPFPTIETWDQLPSFLSEMKAMLHDRPHDILAMQKQCISWWTNYKTYIAQTISDRIAQL
ncbi:exostosin family protein [Flavobacterium sp.]|jgi:hypothetical protein|uniref:exostosin domain-containing protein n=1 Tax=Flavobacterium sp. TaxID=239 RepID=UPI0037C03FCF